MCIIKQPAMHDSTTLISLYPNEYSQGLRYDPFSINVDRCVRSCNTLNDLSNKYAL